MAISNLHIDSLIQMFWFTFAAVTVIKRLDLFYKWLNPFYDYLICDIVYRQNLASQGKTQYKK